MGFSMQAAPAAALTEAERKAGDAPSPTVCRGVFDTNSVHVGHHVRHPAVQSPWSSSAICTASCLILAHRTLAGVSKRTVYNQYDSLVRPLQHWLREQGVRIVRNCKVDDLDIMEEGGVMTVTALRCTRDGVAETIAVAPQDLVFFQNGSMTDASSHGTMHARRPNWINGHRAGLWKSGVDRPSREPASFIRLPSRGLIFTVPLKARVSSIAWSASAATAARRLVTLRIPTAAVGGWRISRI